MRRRTLLLLGPALAASGPARAAATLPRAALVDHEGRPVRLDRVARARPLLLGFFFTGCSTVCPTQTATLRDVQDELRSEPIRPLLISVSLDPFGDTPSAIRQYAERFELRLGDETGWLMLTGPMDELRKVWSAFDAAPVSPSDHAPLLWLASPGAREWTRHSAFASASALAQALRDPAP